MNKELEKQLIERFPSFFMDMYKSPMDTCMAFGCEFFDGWYALMYRMCEEIEEYLKTNTLNYPFRFIQCKEKMASMCIYHNGNDDIQIIVNKFEEQSVTTCEICGKEGKVYDEGWYITRCLQCYNSSK